MEWIIGIILAFAGVWFWGWAMGQKVYAKLMMEYRKMDSTFLFNIPLLENGFVLLVATGLFIIAPFIIMGIGSNWFFAILQLVVQLILIGVAARQYGVGKFLKKRDR